MAFDATVSGTDANSFISVAQFETYCLTRPAKSAALIAALAAVDVAPEEQALVAASEDILYNTVWNSSRVGEPTVSTQRLPFPALFVARPNDNGTYYSSSAQPDFLIAAVSEQAIAYIDGLQFTESTSQQFSSIKADVVEIKYNTHKTAPSDTPTIKERVRRILSFWVSHFTDEVENFVAANKVMAWAGGGDFGGPDDMR